MHRLVSFLTPPKRIPFDPSDDPHVTYLRAQRAASKRAVKRLRDLAPPADSFIDSAIFPDFPEEGPRKDDA